MATYAAYRHIELDKVGHSKKRVRNRSSEIFQVLCTGSDAASRGSRGFLSKKNSQSTDSFQRLFGAPENARLPPRRASLTNHDITHRNPVTGNGVSSWDSMVAKSKPTVFKERNPVTGETYLIARQQSNFSKKPNPMDQLNNNTSQSEAKENKK